MAQRDIMLYLHVHQPFRVGRYSAFDTGLNHYYFSATERADNQDIFRKVAEKSYLPMNRLLQELLENQPRFAVSLSLTGTFLEQCELWGHDVLESFQRLVATGRVEIVAETYYHSLAFFYSRFEFEKQVAMHKEKVQKLFGVTLSAFRNTEFAYNNELGAWAESAGYKAILAEGWDPVLEWRSPHYTYRPPGTETIGLLVKDYRLSDDIAFRFSNRDWSEWPLTSDKYVGWLNALSDEEKLVNLCMDYETFGEHQWSEHGIFEFMRHWIPQWLEDPNHQFVTVTEGAQRHQPSGTLSAEHTITWADMERDLSAWLGNSMQQEALRHLYELEDDVLRTRDTHLIADWRKLQTSDHVYYMCTKWFTDGDVHAYFSPYASPYDAFIFFMNAVRDLRWRIMMHNTARSE